MYCGSSTKWTLAVLQRRSPRPRYLKRLRYSLPWRRNPSRNPPKSDEAETWRVAHPAALPFPVGNRRFFKEGDMGGTEGAFSALTRARWRQQGEEWCATFTEVAAIPFSCLRIDIQFLPVWRHTLPPLQTPFLLYSQLFLGSTGRPFTPPPNSRRICFSTFLTPRSTYALIRTSDFL